MTSQVSTDSIEPATPISNADILKDYISQTLLNGRMEVESDDDLLGDSIIDSMGVMQLVTFVEEKFDIEVAQSDITIINFRTIDAIDAYVAQQHLVQKQL